MKPRRSQLPVLRWTLALYKRTLSPLLAFFGGGGCRFTPTCSEYFVEAVEKRGWLMGTWLAIVRLGRCQPWGGQGHDPVPEAPKPELHTQCPHCK